jgi:hypothetical protein
MSMKKNFVLFFSICLFACNETPKPAKTAIGNTGFTIELLPIYKMKEEKGIDYKVYYITPVDTANGKGEAGIYFGSAPDKSGPESALSQNINDTVVLGKKAHITTYATPTYTWVETIIDESDSLKIQYWYYGYNETEMIGLNKMMSSISRK